MARVDSFWPLVLGTIVALLPLINPLAAAPTFLTITEGDSPSRRHHQLVRACIFMVLILVSALIGGTFIMGFFGISIPGLRIAGGLLVGGIGWTMVLGSGDVATDDHTRQAARAKRDVSFSPLAMPMLSGPGSIAVTIGFTSLARGWMDYLAIIAGIVAVAAITYVVLRLSERTVRLIGVNGMTALTKVMGFLLLCIGAQFVVNGVMGVATDPAFLHAVREALAGH